MFRYKHYTIYKNETSKDTRGNIVRTFVELKKIRGMIITKEEKLFDQNVGLMVRNKKILITRKIYKDFLKIGYKVENLIIKEVLENGQDVICILEGEK